MKVSFFWERQCPCSNLFLEHHLLTYINEVNYQRKKIETHISRKEKGVTGDEKGRGGEVGEYESEGGICTNKVMTEVLVNINYNIE